MNKPNSLYSEKEMSACFIIIKSSLFNFNATRYSQSRAEGGFIANKAKKNSVCLNIIYMVNFIFNVVLLPNFKFLT